MPIGRFRPNIIVTSTAEAESPLMPWAEDRWARVAVGPECIVLKGCKRCP
jgi:uncharacterized protein YcbX